MTRRRGWYSFTGDDCFIELMLALTHPDDRWTEPERPDILSALDELSAWADDHRHYDKHYHASGWESAISDFAGAVDSLGSNMKQRLKSHVNRIRNLYKPGIGADRTRRTQLSAELAAMRRILADTATLIAAWHDLIGVCSREESSSNVVSSRRDTFWAVVRAADRNALELSRQLPPILAGDPLAALGARRELGEIDSAEEDLQSVVSGPLTGPEERLELVVKLLGSEPRSRAHVVWFAFRYAPLTSIRQQLGPIQFLDARSLRAVLTQDGSQGAHAAELDELGNADSIPNHPDVTMARVDLGTGVFSDAVRVARERLDALIAMSSIGCAIPWRRLYGFIHAQDGHVVAARYFVYEDREPESPRAFDRTTAQVSRMAPRVASMIPVMDQDLKDIIDALPWWRAAFNQPTAATIILNVRVIELIARRIGENSWTTYLRKYIKNMWIYNRMENMLFLALHEALVRTTAQEAQAQQRQIFLEAASHEHGQRFHVDRAARHLDTIIQFTPPSLPVGRELRTIKRRTSNATAIRSWCTELERLWVESVDRLERSRNSIAHSGPFTEQAVLLAQPFSQKISIWALGESVEGFLEDKSLARSHKDVKIRWDQWRSSTRTMTSINDIFNH